MDKSDIIDKLNNKIIKEILSQPGRILDKDEPLISSGLIDSFHLVDLALLVEDEFGVRIDDTELNSDSFDSTSQLANLIFNRL